MTTYEYMIKRQEIICKALQILKVIVENQPDQDFITKEEIEMLPDLIEKETLKMVINESQKEIKK